MHIRTVHELGPFRSTVEWGSEVFYYRAGYTVKMKRLFILQNDWLEH